MIGILFYFLVLFLISIGELCLSAILLYEARDSDFKMKFIICPILILLIGARLFLALFSMYKDFEILGVSDVIVSIKVL